MKWAKVVRVIVPFNFKESKIFKVKISRKTFKLSKLRRSTCRWSCWVLPRVGNCLSFFAWEAGEGVPWLQQLPWEEEVDGSTVNFVDGWWVGVSKGRRSDYWRRRPVCAVVHLGRLRPPTAPQSQSEGIQCDSANRVQTHLKLSLTLKEIYVWC